MSEEMVIGIGQEAMKTSFMLAAPLLIVAMVVGVVVSLLQAVTQINEATLSFIPKIIAISIVLLVGAPWMLEVLMNYTQDIFIHFGDIIK